MKKKIILILSLLSIVVPDARAACNEAYHAKIKKMHKTMGIQAGGASLAFTGGMMINPFTLPIGAISGIAVLVYGLSRVKKLRTTQRVYVLLEGKPKVRTDYITSGQEDQQYQTVLNGISQRVGPRLHNRELANDVAELQASIEVVIARENSKQTFCNDKLMSYQDVVNVVVAHMNAEEFAL